MSQQTAIHTMNPKQLSDERFSEMLRIIRDRIQFDCDGDHQTGGGLHSIECLAMYAAESHIAWQREQLDRQGVGMVDAAHRLSVAQKELTTLKAELEEAKKDTGRFQWALDNYQEMIELLTTHLDHAIIRHIDTAIQQKEKE